MRSLAVTRECVSFLINKQLKEKYHEKNIVSYREFAAHIDELQQ